MGAPGPGADQGGAAGRQLEAVPAALLKESLSASGSMAGEASATVSIGAGASALTVSSAGAAGASASWYTGWTELGMIPEALHADGAARRGPCWAGEALISRLEEGRLEAFRSL